MSTLGERFALPDGWRWVSDDACVRVLDGDVERAVIYRTPTDTGVYGVAHRMSDDSSMDYGLLGQFGSLVSRGGFDGVLRRLTDAAHWEQNLRDRDALVASVELPVGWEWHCTGTGARLYDPSNRQRGQAFYKEVGAGSGQWGITPPMAGLGKLGEHHRVGDGDGCGGGVSSFAECLRYFADLAYEAYAEAAYVDVIDEDM